MILLLLLEISAPTEKIENINNKPNGIVSIVGNPNVGKIFTKMKMFLIQMVLLTKLLLVSKSTCIWKCKNCIYEWQISDYDAQNWSVIEYSNSKNYVIPDDPII